MVGDGWTKHWGTPLDFGLPGGCDSCQLDHNPGVLCVTFMMNTRRYARIVDGVGPVDYETLIAKRPATMTHWTSQMIDLYFYQRDPEAYRCAMLDIDDLSLTFYNC